MWKTAIIALAAVGLVSPCDVSGSAAYRVLLARAGGELDAKSDPELAQALSVLGIREDPPPQDLLDRLLASVGLRRSALVLHGLPEKVDSVLLLPDGRLVVLSSPLVFLVLGPLDARLHVLEPTGRLSRTGPFKAGWPGTGPMNLSPGPSRILETGVAFSPEGAARQHYALRGDRFVLVRLEDPETAEIRRNRYDEPHLTVGPPPPLLDADGWRERLASDDAVTLLEALVWLGGVHQKPPESAHGEASQAGIWSEVVTDERTRARLRELAKSSDPWIAEAARCAMEIERYR